MQWKKEYNNFDIVREVFNEVDVIVVPSIWEENSPLVIHESQQCGVPVITADYGGMGELVKNNVNGLTFEFRNSKSLAAAMLQALNEPEALIELSKRGYIGSANGEIPCVEEHGKEMIELYSRVLNPIRATHEVEMNGVSGSERKGTKNKTQTLNYETAKFISNSSKEEEVQSDAGIDTDTDTGGDPRVPIPIIPFPSPWRVTFDTNPDDCNFSCTMCEQHSPYSPHQKERKAQNKRRRRMSFEVIESTVDQLSPKGLREIIPTTMGEPLQYKEFPNILKLCEKQNIKLNLTTNGSFFGRGVVEWAKLIVPVTVDVKISWNGATEETQQKIMKNSKLSKQVESLKEFVKERDNIAAAGGNYCSVTLQLTFMEDNLEEIPDIVAFAIANNCDRVKGHHLWAHFEEIKNQNLRRSTDSILRWNIIAKKCREYAAANPLKNKKILRLDNFFDLELSAAADPLKPQSSSPIHPEAVCPFLGKEAWVNHEGRFDPCCAPDEQRKVLGFFGNINEPGQSIEEIWKSEKYLDLVKNYHKKPLCRGCNMRQPPR